MTRLSYLSGVGRVTAVDLASIDVVRIASDALTASGSTQVARVVFDFVPHGSTAALVAAESHLVFSTWPEHASYTVDILLCGSDTDPERAWELFVAELRPRHEEVARWTRELSSESKNRA